MTEKIHVITNPVSGSSAPDMETLDRIFGECGVEWASSMTKEAGDAHRIASQAAADGVDIVVAYGGDGTVGEVAGGLVGTDASLAILPGGTANVMAIELGIPNDLAEAAYLVCGRESKRDKIDVGMIGERHFVLRAGIGFEAQFIDEADRASKDRLGLAAYLWYGLKNLHKADIAEYRFVIDGEEVECKGFTCAIANSGSLGLPGIRLGSAISVRDGLLDVIVVEEPSWEALLEVLGEVFGGQDETPREPNAKMRDYTAEIERMLRHWQGAEIEVAMEPPQVVQYDGEVLESVNLPITCKVLPRQLNVIVPE